MRQDLRWKGVLILVLVLIFGFLFTPWSKDLIFKKSDPIRLGLDLKGGIELLLVPDYRLGEKDLAKLQEEMLGKLSQSSIPLPQMEYMGVLDNNRYEGLKFTFASAGDVARAQNLGLFPSKYRFNEFGEVKNLEFTPKISGNVVELTVLQSGSDFGAGDEPLQRSLEIIRHRISDQSSGMAEANVQLDRNHRISVQLPGINSLEEANQLITTTGRMTFRLNNQVVLDGRDMGDINVSFNPNGGGYVINFAFKGEGAKQLALITSENIGKNMAVYLDETELMNPVIKSALPDGKGQIEMSRSSKEEVERDALLMKSGALPISLKVQQSTQVAPTLGAEIVRLSEIGIVIGVLLVMIFMLIFYGMPGLLANAALLLYTIFALGVTAGLRGVLTLPGIAGFILSLGVAVDANIIIFERIKDEIRNGKRVRPAVQSGFDRAFITILDCNVTVLISCIVLFLFGSGAVQGFATTLAIGVFVSMFCAVFVTRFFLEARIDHDPDRYAKYFGAKGVVEG